MQELQTITGNSVYQSGIFPAFIKSHSEAFSTLNLSFLSTKDLALFCLAPLNRRSTVRTEKECTVKISIMAEDPDRNTAGKDQFSGLTVNFLHFLLVLLILDILGNVAL